MLAHCCLRALLAISPFMLLASLHTCIREYIRDGCLAQHPAQPSSAIFTPQREQVATGITAIFAAVPLLKWPKPILSPPTEGPQPASCGYSLSRKLIGWEKQAPHLAITLERQCQARRQMVVLSAPAPQVRRNGQVRKAEGEARLAASPGLFVRR